MQLTIPQEELCVNIVFRLFRCTATAGSLRSSRVPRQLPVFYEGKLGQYFRALRDSRGWSLRQAVLIAEQRRLPVRLGALRWLEGGLTKNPEPELLRALSSLYGEPYRNIIQEVARQVFNIEPQELLQGDASPTSPEDFVTLPVPTRPIAAGHPPVVAPDADHDTHLGFRRDFVKRFTRPVVLRVGRKATTMKPTVEPGDVVLIDQNVTRRRRPAAGHIFAINEGPLTGRDGGSLARVDLSGHTLILSADHPDKAAHPTRTFEVKAATLPDILVGEVVWVGRRL